MTKKHKLLKKKAIRLNDDVAVTGHQLNFEIYPITVYFIYGQIEKMIKFDHDVESIDGFVRSWSNGVFMLWVEKKNDLPTIVHETYHLTNDISRHLGLNFGGADEAQAYLMEFLFRAAMDARKN